MAKARRKSQAKLEKRIREYESVKDKEAMKKPGSQKK